MSMPGHSIENSLGSACADAAAARSEGGELRVRRWEAARYAGEVPAYAGEMRASFTKQALAALAAGSNGGSKGCWIEKDKMMEY